MKKGAIARLIIWSVTAVILISVLVAFLNMNKSGIDFGNVSIGFSGTAYKNPESYTVGGGRVSDKVNSIEINWVSGSVNLSAYDGNEIEIVEDYTDDDNYKLRYKVSGNKLIIQPEKSSIGFGIMVNKPVKNLTVKIPVSLIGALRELEIDSTSADVDISGLSLSESIEIDNVSGEIDIKNVKAADISVNTVSGGARVDGEVKSFEADSVSGDISVKSSVAPYDFECDSTSGDIKLEIPEGSGFTLEYDTASGDFNTDFMKTQKGNKHFTGDGSAEYEVDTVSGDLTILKIK